MIDELKEPEWNKSHAVKQINATEESMLGRVDKTNRPDIVCLSNDIGRMSWWVLQLIDEREELEDKVKELESSNKHYLKRIKELKEANSWQSIDREDIYNTILSECYNVGGLLDRNTELFARHIYNALPSDLLTKSEVEIVEPDRIMDWFASAEIYKIIAPSGFYSAFIKEFSKGVIAKLPDGTFPKCEPLPTPPEEESE